jgi:DNA-directed RNA polymerase specialized sigma subunit
MAKIYVKNSDLIRAIKESKEKGQLTRETIEMFVLMTDGISKKMAYKNEEDKQDCIAFALEDLCKYWDRFNPEKSNNPFAYFTQIIWYAFIRRIQKEKKVLYTKYKLIEHVNLMNLSSDTQDHDNTVDFNDNIKMSEWSEEYMNTFMNDFEENKRRKIKKREIIV